MTAGAHLIVETSSSGNALAVVQIGWRSHVARVVRDSSFSQLLKRAEDDARVGSIRTDIVDTGIDENARKRGEQQQHNKDKGRARQVPFDFDSHHRLLSSASV